MSARPFVGAGSRTVSSSFVDAVEFPVGSAGEGPCLLLSRPKEVRILVGAVVFQLTEGVRPGLVWPCDEVRGISVPVHARPNVDVARYLRSSLANHESLFGHHRCIWSLT